MLASLILGGLPLIIYPFILLADVMSLAAPRSSGDRKLLSFVSRAFQIASLLYPAVYVGCVRLALGSQRAGREWLAVAASALPLLYLVMVGLLFKLWTRLSPS